MALEKRITIKESNADVIIKDTEVTKIVIMKKKELLI